MTSHEKMCRWRDGSHDAKDKLQSASETCDPLRSLAPCQHEFYT
jgi:hypothetical protein